LLFAECAAAVEVELRRLVSPISAIFARSRPRKMLPQAKQPARRQVSASRRFDTLSQPLLRAEMHAEAAARRQDSAIRSDAFDRILQAAAR
jgi:hypothetical protein